VKNGSRLPVLICIFYITHRPARSSCLSRRSSGPGPPPALASAVPSIFLLPLDKSRCVCYSLDVVLFSKCVGGVGEVLSGVAVELISAVAVRSAGRTPPAHDAVLPRCAACACVRSGLVRSGLAGLVSRCGQRRARGVRFPGPSPALSGGAVAGALVRRPAFGGPAPGGCYGLRPALMRPWPVAPDAVRRGTNSSTASGPIEEPPFQGALSFWRIPL